MARILLYSLVLGVFLLFGRAEAASTVNWTFYGPGAGGRMQGSMSAASKNLEGTNVIRTLDDVRTGKSKYVTLASATAMKGRYYCIGTVTYTSPPGNGGDGKTHTLENVVGYVHDTGCAFNGTCSCAFLSQFCDGRARTDKMDIAVGNFTGYDGSFAMSYITKNPNRAPKDWTQLAGLPQQQQQNPITQCGGEVRETGTPAPASVIPPKTDDPQNSLTRLLAPATQPQPTPYPVSQSPYQSQVAPTGLPVLNGADPMSYGDPTTMYPQGSVLQVPIPQIQGTATNSMLSVLFQQSSATSGIRSLQTVAESILSLFNVPTTSNTNTTPLPPTTLFTHAPVETGSDMNNVSYMVLSQYDEPRPTADASTTPVFDPIVTPAEQRPVSTFTEVIVSPTPDPVDASETRPLVVKILTSIKSLLQSMLTFLSR